MALSPNLINEARTPKERNQVLPKEYELRRRYIFHATQHGLIEQVTISVFLSELIILCKATQITIRFCSHFMNSSVKSIKICEYFKQLDLARRIDVNFVHQQERQSFSVSILRSYEGWVKTVLHTKLTWTMWNKNSCFTLKPNIERTVQIFQLVVDKL